ncbi:MAG: alternative ribosome rescue aminoacyl-tRNA hydrolase ArfB [Calditrichia bacterium]
MLYITDDILLDENELHMEFIRSSGPGGQNVNKVSTAVQLRFDVRRSPSLPDDLRQRLTDLAGSRISEEGILIISAHRFRTQHQNRRDAVDRLVRLIRKAAEKPKKRRKTRPPKAAVEKRLQEKHRHSEIKHGRGRIKPGNE